MVQLHLLQHNLTHYKIQHHLDYKLYLNSMYPQSLNLLHLLDQLDLQVLQLLQV